MFKGPAAQTTCAAISLSVNCPSIPVRQSDRTRKSDWTSVGEVVKESAPKCQRPPSILKYTPAAIRHTSLWRPPPPHPYNVGSRTRVLFSPRLMLARLRRATSINIVKGGRGVWQNMCTWFSGWLLAVMTLSRGSKRNAISGGNSERAGDGRDADRDHNCKREP